MSREDHFACHSKDIRSIVVSIEDVDRRMIKDYRKYAELNDKKQASRLRDVEVRTSLFSHLSSFRMSIRKKGLRTRIVQSSWSHSSTSKVLSFDRLNLSFWSFVGNRRSASRKVFSGVSSRERYWTEMCFILEIFSDESRLSKPKLPGFGNDWSNEFILDWIKWKRILELLSINGEVHEEVAKIKSVLIASMNQPGSRPIRPDSHPSKRVPYEVSLLPVDLFADTW